MRIRRQFTHLQATFAENTCESTIIDLREHDCLHVFIPAAWTAADLGIKASPVLNTLFKPLYVGRPNAAGATVMVQCTSIAVDSTYAVPVATHCAPFIKLWSQKAGVDEDQTAERILGVTLKG